MLEFVTNTTKTMYKILYNYKIKNAQFLGT